jgi:DNA polymerase-3 subunit delta'
MTVESQNALLKTLEEPPAYVIIILITSNKNSLLDTIKSRCEIIKFLPVSFIQTKKYLEDMGIEERKASILATFSRGSISKALELSESADFMLMREDIQNNIQTLLEKNIVEILELPSKYDKYKDNIIEVLDMMINYFRDIMMLKENIGKDMIINIDKITYVQNMSKKINYSQVSKIIDIIEETKKKLKSNCNFNLSIQVMALNIYEVIK